MDWLNSNKLQAYKSSFQAWKCVSFGYALLALVLLASKWHEVSTDLGLLTGIDQLIWSQTPPTAANTAPNENATTTTSKGTLIAQSWPISSVLTLEAGGHLSSDNNSMQQQQQQMTTTNSSSHQQLMSQHMQMAMSREQNGNDLLRREVEAFLGEFRSAKSTLCLSSLLVALYIVSWILMTLAVNDTRISNDVSLRNILVLSVFGAIDMAASVGFVMVRLIMFNVKNNSFMSEVIGSSGLRDSPIRLSSDQLTAFTALRLIAMRSCSGYVDIYVSVLVALLTLLRLYSVVRAIAYYRFLRHFNEAHRALSFSQQQQQQIFQHPPPHLFHSASQTSFATNDEQPLVGYSSGDSSLIAVANQNHHLHQPGLQSKSAWSTMHHHHPRMAPQPQPQHHLMSPSSETINAAEQHFGPVHMAPDGTEQRPFVVSCNQEEKQHQSTGNTNRKQPHSALANNKKTNNPADSSRIGRNNNANGDLNNNDADDAGDEVDFDLNNNSIKPSTRRAQQKLHQQLNQILMEQQQLKLLESTPTQRRYASLSSKNNLLLVNGRPHRLVSADGNESAGVESEPASAWHTQQQFLQAGGGGRPVDQAAPAAFTLLSAKQLDRLGRQLVANATNASNHNTSTLNGPNGSKYKLLARYRPASYLGPSNGQQQAQRPILEPIPRAKSHHHQQQQQQQQQQQHHRSAGGAESGGSSSLDNESTQADDSDNGAPRLARPRLDADLRQTEELVTGHHQKRTRKELLLSKSNGFGGPVGESAKKEKISGLISSRAGTRRNQSSSAAAAQETSAFESSEPTSGHFES